MAKGTIVGILSSRSRTPLPKLMQSCQSFYAICNRISLRRLRSASVKSSFSAPSAEPPPVANRFDVPSIKDLSLSFLPFLRLFVRPVSFHPSKFPFRFLSFGLSFSLRREEKCPEIFLSPFFRPFPTVFHPRYRPISASQYSACTIVFLETA